MKSFTICYHGRSYCVPFDAAYRIGSDRFRVLGLFRPRKLLVIYGTFDPDGIWHDFGIYPDVMSYSDFILSLETYEASRIFIREV